MISNNDKLSIAVVILVLTVGLATNFHLTQQAYAQNGNDDNSDNVCPDGFNLESGVCIAEPFESCYPSAPVPGQEDYCLSGSFGGSRIPVSEEDPCGVGDLSLYEPGGFNLVIYPNAETGSTSSCSTATQIGLQCPGDTSGSLINPETGLCEAQPNGSTAFPQCPTGTERFERGYCVVDQVPTCPEGFVYDTRGGNCDNPETGEMNAEAVFRCENDLSDPDLSSGCRFRPSDV